MPGATVILMPLMITAMRRSIWLLLIGAVGGAAWGWWRDHNAPPSPSAPPEWPPLEPVAVETVADVAHWVPSNDDGSCPPNHPIKANDKSNIFHVPGGRFYERTKAERCYQTAEAALADGYRKAKA
jgi:hypothetical protein